jgi:hypothetical protein
MFFGMEGVCIMLYMYIRRVCGLAPCKASQILVALAFFGLPFGWMAKFGLVRFSLATCLVPFYD